MPTKSAEDSTNTDCKSHTDSPWPGTGGAVVNRMDVRPISWGQSHHVVGKLRTRQIEFQFCPKEVEQQPMSTNMSGI